MKLLVQLGGEPGTVMPARQPRAWRRRYASLAKTYGTLTLNHYEQLKAVIKQLAGSK
jgi:hypothetical protein